MAELVRQVLPGYALEDADFRTPGEAVYPDDEIIYTGDVGGTTILCDKRFMIDTSSNLTGSSRTSGSRFRSNGRIGQGTIPSSPPQAGPTKALTRYRFTHSNSVKMRCGLCSDSSWRGDVRRPTWTRTPRACVCTVSAPSIRPAPSRLSGKHFGKRCAACRREHSGTSTNEWSRSTYGRSNLRTRTRPHRSHRLPCSKRVGSLCRSLTWVIWSSVRRSS
jgi:hypothetical protein